MLTTLPRSNAPPARHQSIRVPIARNLTHQPTDLSHELIPHSFFIRGHLVSCRFSNDEFGRVPSILDGQPV
ncbi:hypothetical protein GF325_11085 [Candidatus Bathyarchaeota archaeon]|nr:hypothetical protein [Candidatus Bathyarchaeota archaeon]